MVSVGWAGAGGWSHVAGQSTTVCTIPPGTYGDYPFLAWAYSSAATAGTGITTTRALVFTDLSSANLPEALGGAHYGALVVPGSSLDQGATIVLTTTGGTAHEYGAFGAAAISWDSVAAGISNPTLASQVIFPASSGADGIGTLNPAFFGTSVSATTPFSIGATRHHGSANNALSYVAGDAPWCTNISAGSIVIDYDPSLTSFNRYQQAALGLWTNLDPLLPDYRYHISNAPPSSESTVGRFFFPISGAAHGRAFGQVI